MRVLVVSEGKHEQHGALENLVRRLTPRVTDCEHDRVSRPDVHAFHGKGDGYFKRALRWMLEARNRGLDALILVIDEDGKHDRSEQFTRAQEDHRIAGIPRALGVAIRTFDAWMLADETALTRVLGCPAQRQPDPEALRHPKEKCADLLENSRIDLEQAEMYASIAAQTDLETLKTRCPRGFAPFAERVEAL